MNEKQTTDTNSSFFQSNATNMDLNLSESFTWERQYCGKDNTH